MTSTILIISANPTDTAALALDEEHRTIDDERQRADHRNAFQLRDLLAARIDDVRRALGEQPAVVHFAGHGQAHASSAADSRHFAPVSSEEVLGELVLKDDNGRSAPVPIEALADLFGLKGAAVKCAVLNACSSLAQAKAIARHVPCVIGTSAPVLDRSAREFSKGFYGEIFGGATVRKAFDVGKNAVALKGARDAELFELVGEGDFVIGGSGAAPGKLRWSSKLSGAEFKELAEALRSAFPTRKALAYMMKSGLGQNLDEIAADGNMRDTVFELIVAAEGRGFVPALFDAALAAEPQNADLLAIARKRSA